MPTTAIRGGTIITPWGEQVGDLVIEANTIASIGDRAPRADREIDATGCIVSPGFVQTHVHLCQTAFSGLAENLPVIDWLERWVWPLERAHDAVTSEASARWGVAEMLLSGTTSFLSMESAWYVDSAFEAAAELGARATIGKAVMDRREPGTDLHAETREEAWDDVMRLLHRWHGAEDDRLRLAVSPRAPSAASHEMWNDLLELATRTDLVIHTHVNENRAQAEHVSGANGMRDVEYLASLGALTRRTVLAHCVWLTDAERALLAETGTHVAHCPVANLKLGSGIADVPALLEGGVNVTLGTDGAACNNTLDARREMGFAALVHRAHGGAHAVDARAAFAMATSSGARALGYGTRSGRLHAGMRADISVFQAPQFHAGTSESAIDHLVFSGSAARARTVLVDGRVVVDDFALVRADAAGIRRAGASARATLAERIST
ncbi:MAG: amidohydrolase family protein [Microbacterium sp.]|uniref:amidohydrolase family protein n=1 Tax=Microbacterium sp. TaxID=51671 RepID=UPI002718D578|nr:amidohydrolase family protein [Microbacterium sp.]MDO8383029.1 amidohydrolase family protein [Microbacterium sp.]